MTYMAGIKLFHVRCSGQNSNIMTRVNKMHYIAVTKMFKDRHNGHFDKYTARWLAAAAVNESESESEILRDTSYTSTTRPGLNP